MQIVLKKIQIDFSTRYLIFDLLSWFGVTPGLHVPLTRQTLPTVAPWIKQILTHAWRYLVV